MKNLAVLGVVLIALGIIALGYQGFTYFTRENVIDIRHIHATVEKKHTIPIQPIVGIVAVIAGVAIIVSGKRT